MADTRPASAIKATELGARLLQAAQRQAAARAHIEDQAAALYQQPPAAGEAASPQ